MIRFDYLEGRPHHGVPVDQRRLLLPLPVGRLLRLEPLGLQELPLGGQVARLLFSDVVRFLGSNINFEITSNLKLFLSTMPTI